MTTADWLKPISPYLDRHLLFPVIQHLQKNEGDSQDDLRKVKLQLLEETSMVDFAIDIYTEMGKEVPTELREKRAKVISELKRLQAACLPLTKILADENLVAQLRAEKLFNLSYLEQNFQITAEMVESLYDLAQCEFDTGNYLGASDHLFHFRALSNNGDKNFNALWGKLAAEILMEREEALEDFSKLKEAIDNKAFVSPVQQLNQRTWLMNWGLFLFFRHKQNGQNLMIDTLFQEKYMNTIQTNCPHMLRYLAAVVITNKRKRNALNDIVKVIQQERYQYRDPITDFLDCLYSQFDFDGAQQKLVECQQALQKDYFLCEMIDEFVESARLLIFETYCRIHQVIDINMLAQQLNMASEEAEKWVVNLIRNARFDAKIDSEHNHVIMGAQNPSIHQQVIEKTKALAFRSSVIVSNLEQRKHGVRTNNQEETVA